MVRSLFTCFRVVYGEGVFGRTVDDINPALPIIRNIPYNSHSNKEYTIT